MTSAPIHNWFSCLSAGLMKTLTNDWRRRCCGAVWSFSSGSPECVRAWPHGSAIKTRTERRTEAPCRREVMVEFSDTVNRTTRLPLVSECFVYVGIMRLYTGLSFRADPNNERCGGIFNTGVVANFLQSVRLPLKIIFITGSIYGEHIYTSLIPCILTHDVHLRKFTEALIYTYNTMQYHRLIYIRKFINLISPPRKLRSKNPKVALNLWQKLGKKLR